MTSYALSLVNNIFAAQSTSNVMKIVKGMIDMVTTMSVTTYMMNRAIKQAHRNSNYSSKPLGLSFQFQQDKVVTTIAEDAPMVLRRMRLERKLVEDGRVEPTVETAEHIEPTIEHECHPVGTFINWRKEGSAAIVEDSSSLYRPGSDDSQDTYIYDRDDLNFLDRVNSDDMPQ